MLQKTLYLLRFFSENSGTNNFRNFVDPTIIDVDVLERIAISGTSFVRPGVAEVVYTNGNFVPADSASASVSSTSTSEKILNSSHGNVPTSAGQSLEETSMTEEAEHVPPFSFPLKSVAPDIALVGYKGKVIPFDSLPIKNQIGEGGFATVYLSEFEGKKVAVKKLNPKEGSTAREISAGFREFRQEILIQGRMNHPNIVNLLGICLAPFCLVAEFIPCGTLYDYIHNYDVFYGYDMRLKIAEDLARGLKYMHTELDPLVVHIDFKSPNVMMQSLNPSDPIVAKITDFGTSRNYFGIHISGRFVENPRWLAPEILTGQGYDYRVDVYALGVILWEILTRKVFFEEEGSFNAAMEDKIVKGLRSKPLGMCPKLYQEIVEACWV